LREAKKYFTNLSHLSEQKNTLLNHHVHHAIHHVLTTKKPRSKRRFPQNPQQKPQLSRAKKYSPEIHRKRRLG
jgi:hypothetical protein